MTACVRKMVLFLLGRWQVWDSSLPSDLFGGRSFLIMGCVPGGKRLTGEPGMPPDRINPHLPRRDFEGLLQKQALPRDLRVGVSAGVSKEVCPFLSQEDCKKRLTRCFFLSNLLSVLCLNWMGEMLSK